jgi:hypothetical protein
MEIAFVALTALSAIGKMNAANAQAQAAVTQGDQQAANQVKTTDMQAGQATAAFLGSGFTFAGTAKTAVADIFQTGKTDVQRIDENANTAAKNAISQGRAAAIGTIASSAGMYAMGAGSGSGSAGAMFDTAGSYLPTSGIEDINQLGFGNDAYNMATIANARAGNVP